MKTMCCCSPKLKSYSKLRYCICKTEVSNPSLITEYLLNEYDYFSWQMDSDTQHCIPVKPALRMQQLCFYEQ